MQVPNRFYNDSNYRYGFNGKEKDDEVKGGGLQYDYGFRIYDPRIGRFFSTDPLFAGYPYYSPYQFAGNRPIWAMDLDGLEELCTTRKTVTIVRAWGKTITGKVWYGGGGKGKYVQTGETLVEQGDEGAPTEITERIYTQTTLGGYNVSERKYIEPVILEPSIPSVDPNDNSREINTPPCENPEVPALQTTNEKQVISAIEAKNKEVITKKIEIPQPKKPIPPYKPGDVIDKSLKGLIFPRIESTGMNFEEGGQFPGREYLTKLVNDVKKNKNITLITISGFMTHGSGESSSKVGPAFYNGLMKLDQILHRLGLPDNIKVRVDYNNTKVKQIPDKEKGEFKIKFKLK